jgi:alginate O-acetyltransferase complex protein AlgI
MFFNSIHFLFFLPIVILLYFLSPYKYRWALLLIASYYFYMVWKPIYIVLIVISTLVDYYCGIKMGEIETKKKRKPYIIISILSNLLILGTFKYFNFFNTAVHDLAELLNIDYAVPYLSVLLPMGISFYTFQTMSYSIDIYKGSIKPEKHLGKFALYVTFFPQLVAGPIERAKSLLSQFHFKFNYDHGLAISGLRLILWGLFKKVVIADQLSSMVSHVFDNPANANGFSIYFASLCFAQQIYCDFSGYSDIAQGSARIMGIRLMDNFNFPFYATSYNNFWGRWHTSLMQWFRDYIMFPLIRKRMKWQTVFFIVFLVSGLWHGADWTFIIWGAVNGILVVNSKASANFREKIALKFKLDKAPGFRHFLQIFGVVNLFAIPGIFFPARSLSDAKILIYNYFTGWGDLIRNLSENLNGFRQEVLYLGKEFEPFCLIMIFVVIFEIIQWKMSKDSIDNFFTKKPRWKTWSIYLFLTLSIILMSYIEKSPFIYFQF